MSILAGVLFLIISIIPFIFLFVDSGLAILGHVIKLLIGVAAIAILFNIGAPIWMSIISIASVLIGLVGGILAVSGGSLAAFLFIMGGLTGNIAVGVSLLF